jgi:hypothetical protein
MYGISVLLFLFCIILIHFATAITGTIRTLSERILDNNPTSMATGSLGVYCGSTTMPTWLPANRIANGQVRGAISQPHCLDKHEMAHLQDLEMRWIDSWNHAALSAK